MDVMPKKGIHLVHSGILLKWTLWDLNFMVLFIMIYTIIICLQSGVRITHRKSGLVCYKHMSYLTNIKGKPGKVK